MLQFWRKCTITIWSYKSFLAEEGSTSHSPDKTNAVNFRLPPSAEEQAQAAAAAMGKLILLSLKFAILFFTVEAVFEDQVGKFDWQVIFEKTH